MGDPVAWVDGALVPIAEAALPPDDGAFQTGLGCYTTARVDRGAVRHEARVVERLRRDAARLGLGAVPTDAVAAGMRALAEAQFGETPCIVRFQASSDPRGALRIVGVARAIGPEPACWHAVVASMPHPGPQGAPGVKWSGRPALQLALAEARAADAHEALLFDASGVLVEGGRSNLVVVDADGAASVPPRALGAVAGVALGIVDDALALPERETPRSTLSTASELVALNSVRGARAIVAIDGAPVGAGEPGPWAARCAAILDAAA